MQQIVDLHQRFLQTQDCGLMVKIDTARNAGIGLLIFYEKDISSDRQKLESIAFSKHE